METFIKRLINEHKDLYVKIKKLEKYIHNDNTNDKVEFANKCIQLAAMKKYEEALRARIENQGIVVGFGGYYTKVEEHADTELAKEFANKQALAIDFSIQFEDGEE